MLVENSVVPWLPPLLLLSWSCINKPEDDKLVLEILTLSPLLIPPGELLLLGKKLRLKRLAAGEELLLLLWRSGSCMSPCNCGLFGKPWFASWMNKEDECIDCGGWPNEEGFDGEIRCSNFAPPALPSRNILLDGGFWFCSGEIWEPSCDRPRLMWLLPKRWLPIVFKLVGCLALSWASASQKALWVIKLSRLQQLQWKQSQKITYNRM